MLFFKLAITIICIATANLVYAGFGEQKQPRKININYNEQIIITRNGQGYCEIFVDPQTSPTAKFAAKELQKYLSQSTGIKIPIVSKRNKNRTCIIVGNSPLVSAYGIDVKKLPRDGFIIKSFGNQIVIAGKDDNYYSPVSLRKTWGNYYERATLFGVYDFLERFIGAKFIFPGAIGTIIPQHKELKIPSVDILDRPDNIVRQISWRHGKWYNNSKVLFQKHLNSIRLRMQTTYIPNCHGLARMAYVERFGKIYPEYFALKQNGTRSNILSERHGGQLCFSSAIKKEIFKDAKSFLKGESPKKRNIFHHRFQAYAWDKNAAMNNYFNLMPQDSAIACQCKKCKLLASKSPNWQSNQIWEMTCDIARRLEIEGIKGYVTQMAYGKHSKIPLFDIPGNVLVMVAVNGAWSKSIPKMWDEQKGFIEQWTKKLNHKVWLWNYTCKYGKTDIPYIPCSTPKAVGNFYQSVQPEIFGAFMESECDYTIFQFLNWYVFSKKMWNKNISTAKLLNGTYKAMFGKASNHMKKFFDRLEKLWLYKICGKTVMASDGPSVITPSINEIWNKIYNEQELYKLNSFLVNAQKMVSKNSLYMKRISFIRKNFYKALKKGRQEFISTQNTLTLLKGKITKIDNYKINIDGKLDEIEWKLSPELYLGRLAGAQTQIKTKVRLLRDDNNLYISYECEEPDIKNIFCQKLSNDDKEIWKNSCVEIFLSPQGIKKYYYQWMIDLNCNITDLKVLMSGNKKYDYNWNSKAKAKILKLTGGWNIELKIPIKKLGIINPENILANFTRTRVFNKKIKPTLYYSWSPFIKNYSDVNNFGILTFKNNSSKNIISDGDFRVIRKERCWGKWFAPKSLKSTQKILLDNKFFLFGGKSLKIKNNGKLNLNISQFIDGIATGEKYKITVFIRTQVNKKQKTGGVFIHFNDGLNTSIPKIPIKNTTPWTAYSKIITAKAPKCYIRLYNYKFKGTAWFDGISVEKIDK